MSKLYWVKPLCGSKAHKIYDEEGGETFELEDDGYAWGYTECGLELTGYLVDDPPSPDMICKRCVPS